VNPPISPKSLRVLHENIHYPLYWFGLTSFLSTQATKEKKQKNAA